MRSAPYVYEINTWTWLYELTQKYGGRIGLGEVPPGEWDEIASWGFDAVWLMGVWERSPAGIAVARNHPGLQSSYREALTDFRPDDVAGSPYSVRSYSVDPKLGGNEGLMRAREELAERKLALVLDFVPNHVALDHPWTREHPEYFIHDEQGRIANGRDPYFPPWTDTAQINTWSPQARDALVNTLLGIARQCDGVRCDMAMLLLNDVFARTWGKGGGAERPRDEFWPGAIGTIKREFPDFTFIAEVYWDLEWTMQQLGFDYCYDKRLYDRLAYADAAAIRSHLAAGIEYQRKLIRGLENHDEPRAAAVFPEAQEQAAAVITTTTPGAKLFQHGQFEGRRVRVPVQLRRVPAEPENVALRDFYWMLLQACRDPVVRDGEWRLLDLKGWPDNSSCANLLAWGRELRADRSMIVVNYSGQRSQARVQLRWGGLCGRTWRLRDLLTSDVFARDGDELQQEGLYVDLPAWGVHFLRFDS